MAYLKRDVPGGGSTVFHSICRRHTIRLEMIILENCAVGHICD
jgi:hypothetical protein